MQFYRVEFFGVPVEAHATALNKMWAEDVTAGRPQTPVDVTERDDGKVDAHFTTWEAAGVYRTILVELGVLPNRPYA